MKNKKTLIFIILIVWMVYSGVIFVTNGIESGYSDWRFYASLMGFLIPLAFLFLLNNTIKNKSDSIK